MGLFGFKSSHETQAPANGVENSSGEIVGLDSVRTIVGLDRTYDGTFLTPTNSASEYSEKDWKTLRTEAFLSTHPEWNELYASQKEWQDLATLETAMQSRYGEHIDERNRFLDSLRSTAVEKGELSKEMIEAAATAFGYTSPSLVNEIYDRYEREIRNRRLEPEDPSDAYQKYTALQRRNRAYLEKIIYAQDVARGLRKQKMAEDKQGAFNHKVTTETNILVEKKQDAFADKEKALKVKLRESITQIPLLDRMQWRPHFADQLRTLRADHTEYVSSIARDYEGLRDVGNAKTEVALKNIQSETLSAAQKLGEAQNDFDGVKGIPAPTKEEIKEVHAEIEDAVSTAINALLLEYKVEGYDELSTKKRIVELEEKIAQLAKNIPYLNASGEPNRETLEAFLA